jgi:hypothetical protein
VISGTTATHGLCTDYLDQNEPEPVFGDYVAARPSKAHSKQYLLSSAVALTSQTFAREQVNNYGKIQPAFVGSG